ncbi:uncharacterized protein LACBIDRAFT_304209 [Laccaria bicolor S238N-H82]|uniref:Predicted protein n=1 Tax=Laccaria bicolor (strain S238N-H82 / ATCC MYA-4686) TaxID=486041 RepID=B0E4C6_LACBS|nr:uncharacterized protein LACBIDRAFT_304209 [Laccaria bicolor S238N-H82]EDQ98305.1 predicted protein [Laccaria bicolor S238N-H82]|eukprot:XP_001891044.1 predicted protein [Laccaria bicolor S238N-H82]
MIGERTLMGWPFLQEGSVVAVSDSLFKYEKMTVVPGTPAKVISNPHAPQGLGHWKMKADHIEQVYSKRSGVITRTVDISYMSSSKRPETIGAWCLCEGL